MSRNVAGLDLEFAKLIGTMRVAASFSDHPHELAVHDADGLAAHDVPHQWVTLQWSRA
jgi:hypothetical protein